MSESVICIPRRRSRRPALGFLLCFFFFTPPSTRAQSVGQIECARSGGFVYLYSSIETLDIRRTLECGQQVEITGRYDSYFAVRTASGETGYVPLESVTLLKTAPGAKPALSPAKSPTRERTFYDPPAKPGDSASKTENAASALLLLDSTPIQMKISKTISSADAKVGDEVPFQVSAEVLVGGFLVVPKGATGIGVVNEAEPRKALGRGGKLSVIIRSVRLADNEEVGLRSDTERKGSSSAAGVVVPLMHGKDITFPQGMEFTAYVNGDRRLKRENFRAAESAAAAPTAPTGGNPHP
ncbi:MAG TPA: hypothetical protein VJN42_11150 [Candidatus Acidoferrum sp.]|nr:hypothetical protein [Candidatus Acidoferrum sp.]